jgi:hypothetical protein
LICRKCYYVNICYRRPSLDDRCGYYLKKSKVKLNRHFDLDVNPFNDGELNDGKIKQKIVRK